MHNHVYLCEKLLPHPVQEIQSLQWKRLQPGLLHFAAEAGRYAANDDENGYSVRVFKNCPQQLHSFFLLRVHLCKSVCRGIQYFWMPDLGSWWLICRNAEDSELQLIFRFLLQLEACVQGIQNISRIPNTLKMGSTMSENWNPQFIDSLILNLFWSDFELYLFAWLVMGIVSWKKLQKHPCAINEVF